MSMTQYEKDFLSVYGDCLVIKTINKNEFFECWGYGNHFTNDWNLAMKYKTLKTVNNAIKKLTLIHKDRDFVSVPISKLMAC